MLINSQTRKVYQAHYEVRQDFPNTSLPADLTNEVLAAIGVFPLMGSEPAYNPISRAITEQEAVEIAGVWTRQWEIVDLTPEQTAINQAAKDLADSQRVQAKVEALWAATDRYVTGYISGVAIGILTIGVLQQKPKALAVTSWSSAIWAEYYTRKSLITLTSQDNHDFSSFGPMPYSVPELQEEVGL